MIEIKVNGTNNFIPLIVQVGAGGFGSAAAPHIAQVLSTSSRGGAYVIVDPDVIEEKNIKNQLFLDSEVGFKKAEVLASRYSSAYNIPIYSLSNGFIESVKDLKRCFSTTYLHGTTGIMGYQDVHTKVLPIIIGGVDNAYSRGIMDQLFQQVSNIIYIDSGNEATVMPDDWQTRPKEAWTAEELQTFNESGWTGQVVVGYKSGGKEILPSVCSVFPDLLEGDLEKPSEVSCSDAIASFPQRSNISKLAALVVANILSEILEEGTISTRMVQLHAKKNYMLPFEC